MRSRGTWAVLAVTLASSPPAGAQVRLAGFVEYDNITYFETPDPQVPSGRNQGILQLELRHRAGAVAEIFGSVEIRNDQADPTRNRTFLDEAYITIYLANAEIRVGKQIYAWGRADAFNPTDNLTAWDYSDFLDTDQEKIGAVSVRADYYVGPWTVEGVIVPTFTPSVLPPRTSRWWPALPAEIPNPAYPGQQPATLSASYRYADPILPGHGVRRTQYALRVSGTVRGWDVAVSWFDGYNDLPAVHTTTTLDDPAPSAEILFEPQYHRRRAVGVDFATVIGRVGVRGEAAYFLTEDWRGTDPAIDDPYVQYTVSLDYTIRNVVRDQDLFVLIEWIHELQIPSRNTVYETTDLNHALRQSLIGKADLGVGDFTTLTLEGIWNVYGGDWWLQPGLVWSVTDGLELVADVDLLGGPADSFFGTFRDNGRFHGRLKYSF